MRAVPETSRMDPPAAGAGRALIPFRPARGRAFAWPPLRHGLLVAGFGLAIGVGAVGSGGARHLLHLWSGPAQPDAQAVMLHRLQDQVGRLQGSLDAMRTASDAARPDEPLRGLRRSVEALKQDVEQVRASGTVSVAQLAGKIDKADHDPSPKLAEIVARLDRIEHAAVAPKPADAAAPKVADIAARMDRIEKQVASSTPTASVPTPAATHPAPLPSRPADVATAKGGVTQVAGSTTQPTPPARPAMVEGWVLRDVYDGVALVEARGGGVREVQPGEYLPGAGQVRSIERRGRGWVILTSRGVIDNATF